MKKDSIDNIWRIAGRCSALVVLLGMVFSPACAPLPPSRQIPVVHKDPFRNVPPVYRLKARQNENAKDLPMAIFCWRIVEGFRPDDPQAKTEIKRLLTETQTQAQKNYAQGLRYFQEKKTSAARDEFLLALFYNRHDRKALNFLQKDIFTPETIAYRVKKGDNSLSIARKLYHDPKKSFLVAYFSGPGDTSSPTPGEILHLPIIEPAPPVKKPRAVTLIQKAQALFKMKKYQEAISLAENIVAYGPSPAAGKVINGSHYALALNAFHSGRLPEAMKLFEMVNSNYKKASDYIRRIKNQLHVMADYHYKKGMHYFVNEALKKAIQEWETTLRLNPEHAKARADLQKARIMLKNLNGR